MDYLVTDTELTSVADAIRTKGGTSADLVFPADFVSAINNIQGGYSIDDIAQGVIPTGDIVLSSATNISDYAFCRAPITSVTSDTVTNLGVGCFAHCKQLTSVSLSALRTVPTGVVNATNWSDFESCSNLVSVDFPSLELLSQRMFYSCTKLANVSIPSITRIRGSYVFYDCQALTSFHSPSSVVTWDNLDYSFWRCNKMETIVLPTFNKGIGSNAFRYCSKLQKADFGSPLSIGNADNFNSCTVLDTLILRKTDSICTMNTLGNNFNNTPFASNGSGGTLYVPSALISAYQSAAGWSTLLGYANNQILPIEGSIYETQYADGTSI